MKISILILFLLLTIPSSFAISYFQEANTDLNLGGGMGFSAFALNLQNSINGANYTTCTIDSGSYTPIIDDLNSDNSYEVIVSSGTQITIYNTNCQVWSQFDVSNTIKSAITSINYDANDYPNIVFLTDWELQAWEYDPSTGAMVRRLNITYRPAPYAPGDLNYLTCFRHATTAENNCVGVDAGQDETVTFDLNGETATVNNNELNTNILAYFDPVGWSSTRIYSNTDFYAAMGLSNLGGGAHIGAQLIDHDGNYIRTIGTTVGSNSVTDVYYFNAFTAKLGSTYRVFYNVDYERTGALDSYFTGAYETGSVKRLAFQSNNGQVNQTSHWVVGDYNLDGTNDACIFIDLDVGDVFFNCYTVALTTPFISYNMTGTPYNFTKSFVLADFDASKSTMGIGTVDGIYYITGDNTADLVYDSGYESAQDMIRNLALASQIGSSSPIVAYTDSSGGFITVNELVEVSCPNGVCDDFENEFSCPADCNATAGIVLNATGSTCNTGADCQSGYCLARVCRLKPGHHDCTSDAQCLSGTCSNNVCTQPGAWSGMEEGKKQFLGDDVNTNNMISLLIMIVVPIVIFFYGGASLPSGAIALISFVGLALFFAIVGWLSLWIILTIFIFALILVVIAFMIGGGSH